jgi:hypothetical protein
VKSIESFDPYAIFYAEYCRVKNIVKEEYASFSLKFSQEVCNNLKYVDYGILLTIIDGLTSYSQSHLAKLHKKRSLSVNLNIKVFRQIEPEKEYELMIKIESVSKKYTCFKCKMEDNDGKLICMATHFKRNLKPKF